MSLTTYLKNRLGISYKEASLVESQVKQFTEILKEEKKSVSVKNPRLKEISKAKKLLVKKLKEQDAEEPSMEMEEPMEEEPSMEMEEPMESPMEDMDASDDLLVGNGMYEDNEVEMMKVQLKSIMNHAESILNSLTDENNIDAWIQSKVTLAQDYINSVHDYIVYSDNYSEESMESTEEPMEMEEPMVEEPAMEMEEPAMEEEPVAVQEKYYDNSFKKGFISF